LGGNQGCKLSRKCKGFEDKIIVSENSFFKNIKLITEGFNFNEGS